MKTVLRVLAYAALLSLPHTASAGVVTADSVIGGKTMAEWTAEWWKWTWGFNLGEGPADDPTGNFAHLGNVGGPVFFLGASDGRPFDWNIAVPHDQYVLFPVLTVGDFRSNDGRTDEEILAGLLAFAETATGLYARLNGVDILPQSYQLLSPWYDFHAAPNNGYIPGGDYYGVNHGTWIMLEPLAPGTHTLSFGGSYPEFPFFADSNVTLTPTPEPGTLVLVAVAVLAAGALRRVRAAGMRQHRPAAKFSGRKYFP